MPTFERFLSGRGLSPATVAGYARTARELRAWLEGEGVGAEEATYRDLLAWLRCLDVGPRTRNGALTAARHYFDHLAAEGQRDGNPARGLVVRGERRRLPHDLLTREQLDALYRGYSGGPPARERNRAVLGLLVYQALRVHEVYRLGTEDVDPDGGTIRVPATRIGAVRTLDLEGHQVLGLHRYLTEHRPALLAATGEDTARLFVSAGGSGRLNNALAILLRELRGRHPHFRDANQLRASRLALWLRAEPLREVQYLAGHRYVSSTERYQAQDLDRLQAALDRHHPLS
jgi:integrase/recombinase XerD